MANLHILDTADRSEYRVVAHVPVPNANNAAGVNWRTVVLRSGKGGSTVLSDGDGTGGTIASTEKASIASGTLLEVVTTLRADTVPLAGIGAYLDAEFNRIKADAQERLQAELKYFGYTR